MASKRIYVSSTGDTWDLVREGGDRVFVLHRANVASGGSTRTYELDAFLSLERHTPQNVALVSLIGSLAEDA